MELKIPTVSYERLHWDEFLGSAAFVKKGCVVHCCTLVATGFVQQYRSNCSILLELEVVDLLCKNARVKQVKSVPSQNSVLRVYIEFLYALNLLLDIPRKNGSAQQIAIVEPDDIDRLVFVGSSPCNISPQDMEAFVQRLW